jgi:hypothetical protein
MRSFACLMILFLSLATAVASPQEEARPMPDSRIRGWTFFHAVLQLKTSGRNSATYQIFMSLMPFSYR